MQDRLTEEAKQNIVVNEFVLAFAIEPGRALSGAITRILEKAWRDGFDGLDLLYTALAKIKQPDTVKLAEIPVKSPCLVCNLCNRKFEKGVNGWRGNKKSCKQPCTIGNLKPAVNP